MPDRSEAIFTAAFDREVRVSVDRRKVTHRAMAWSADYTPETLLIWLEFYEGKAETRSTPQCLADIEILRAARDLLAKDGALP